MGKTVYDALIVGAGPAGSTAAFILASCGLKVALLDRRDFPRPKLCGGLLTWKTIRLLETVFHITPRALAEKGVLRHAAREYGVCDRCRREVRRTLDHPFHLVDREAYDHFLLQHAISAGADFRPGSAVASVDFARCEAVTRNGEKWTGRFIIGADGVNSRVRRILLQARKIAEPRHPGFAAALECVVPRQPGAFPDHPAIYYGFIPWGYAWSFPAKGGRILGIAALKAKAGRCIRAGFRNFLAHLGLADTNALPIQTHAIPYGNHLDTPGSANVLVVGDAAGLADPFLGEGIYYAQRSAQLAAHAVLESRTHPGSAIDRYREGFRRVISPELRYARAGRQIIFSLPSSLYFPVLTALLRLMPKVCEETIQGQRTFRWFQRVKTLAGCPARPSGMDLSNQRFL
jgi:geranylgeranyl reductase family protein